MNWLFKSTIGKIILLLTFSFFAGSFYTKINSFKQWKPATPTNVINTQPTPTQIAKIISSPNNVIIPSPTPTTEYKILSVKKSEFVDFINKTEKNMFITFYKSNCDTGEGDYVSVLFCSTKNDLIFVSYTTKNPELTDNPLSHTQITEKIKQMTLMFNSEIVNNGWLSQALQKVTDENPVEIEQSGINFEISKMVGDYSITVNGEKVTTEKVVPNYNYEVTNYPKYYNFGTYLTNERLWNAIRINPLIEETEILSLAKEIHKSNPNNEFKIFDDDNKTEYEKYKYWEKNYPNGEFDTWAEERYVGSIQKFPHPSTNKLVWTLVSGNNKLSKDYILE